MGLTAPVIETERLILRPFRATDLDTLHGLWSDPAVTRHTTGKSATRKEAWDRLLRYAGLWNVLGFGYWAVVEKQSGAHIGDVGFADMMRAIDPPLTGEGEAGWAFAPAAQGRGLALEAMRAALRFMDEAHPLVPTCCIIAPDNTPSFRLAAALGFVLVGEVMHRSEPVMLLRRPIGGARGR
jgi:RimJ/RimL family protein N-acetyltransferase